MKDDEIYFHNLYIKIIIINFIILKFLSILQYFKLIFSGMNVIKKDPTNS